MRPSETQRVTIILAAVLTAAFLLFRALQWLLGGHAE